MHILTHIDATIYVGGLDEKVSESLLWELFVQAGPVGKLKAYDCNNYIKNGFLERLDRSVMYKIVLMFCIF